MSHSHLINITEPGCYESELKATLETNNLPSIKIPNSTKLLATLTQIERNDTNEEEIGTDDIQAEELRKENTHTTEAKPVKAKKLTSKDKQLKFYTK
ncbi:hypothetical protein E2C01_027837 [Portunus trituberculatus]|uniref:Uncharacterized protein n=1 Tax=Portunus trituberculatus TaxID=210409 RepID=A0A5B7ELZ1_PORTR|nr:hypothetical protein [Portunus trituberculatus]